MTVCSTLVQLSCNMWNAIITRCSLWCYVVEGAGQVFSSLRGLEAGSHFSKDDGLYRMSVLFIPDRWKGSDRNNAWLLDCLSKHGSFTVVLIYQVGDVISACAKHHISRFLPLFFILDLKSDRSENGREVESQVAKRLWSELGSRWSISIIHKSLAVTAIRPELRAQFNIAMGQV